MNHMIIFGVIGIFVFAAAAGIITIPSGTLTLDPTCIPGSVLLPEYSNYECVEGGTKSVPADSAIFNGIYWEIRISCTYHDYNDWSTQGCTFTPNWNPAACTKIAGDYNVRKDSEGLIIVNCALFNTPTGQVAYPFKYLKYTGAGNYRENYLYGCDLTQTNLGIEEWNRLDKTYMRESLKVGEVRNSIARFQAYPSINLVEYGGSTYNCEFDGTSGSLYDLIKYETASNFCYFLPASYYTEVDCCPGTVRIDGATCSPQLTWTEPSGSGCCPGSPPACSVLLCPGEGGWDWQGFNPYVNTTVNRYLCDSITQTCLVLESKAAECNPINDLGCPSNKECDHATLTCRDPVQVQKFCTEAGYECCLEGMFPNIKDIRTCQDAGYGDDYTCVNGYCYDTTPAPCDFWCWLAKLLTLIVTAFIISGIITMLLWFIMKFPTGIALIIWVVIALGLMVLMYPMIASFAASIFGGV